MKTPLLLIGASLVFWGWQTGLWYFAIVMAVGLEGSRLIQSRLDLSLSDFSRIADFCTLIFVGMLVYLLLSTRSAGVLLVLIQWLPLAFLPIVAAQVYSTQDRIDISALFLIMRIERVKRENILSTAVNLTYPYFALCVIAASAANVRTIGFYAGLFVLTTWALWSFRSRRYSPVLWACLLVAMAGIGYAGQIGLHRLQFIVEEKTIDRFSLVSRKDADPYRAVTAIGDIGRLKLSDRILFRVRMEPPVTTPLLLREASYNVYKSNRWFASRVRFKPLRPDNDKTTWRVPSHPDKNGVIHVSTRFKGGKGMLKLPTGSSEISRLSVIKLVRNQYGAVKVKEGPGWADYQVQFGRHTTPLDSPPDETDLFVPAKEMPALARIARRIELYLKPPEEKIKSISDFFENHFKYTLFLLKSDEHTTTPLVNFLEHTQAGHCEYFATAAVLLLRAAGIPARYAAGYCVDEFSRLESRYVVRSRHAHAWALAYVNGAWINVDTTPSTWLSIEQKRESTLQPLYDLWSWGMSSLSAWRWKESEGGRTRYIWLLLIPLFLILVKRFYARGRVRHHRAEPDMKKWMAVRSGLDSAFYRIEKELMERGYERHSWETWSSWVHRLRDQAPLVDAKGLQDLVSLHYRYRFDPEGITSEERDRLISNVTHWLLHRSNERSGT